MIQIAILVSLEAKLLALILPTLQKLRDTIPSEVAPAEGQ